MNATKMLKIVFEVHVYNYIILILVICTYMHFDKKVVTFIFPKEKMTPLHFEVTRLNVKCQLHWTLIQALVSLRSR